MTEPRTRQRGWLEQLTTLALAALLFIVLASQLQSLFVFPQPNALRWFGDETWLMTEARSQVTEGVSRYPLAVGTSLTQSKGAVLGMTWLSGVLYGVPALVLHGSVVSVGRMVTMLIGLSLLGLFYFGAMRWKVDRRIALLGMILLVANRAFFFASHSCRTDLLAGAIVFAVVIALELRHKCGPDSLRSIELILLGSGLSFFAVSSSLHLLTLLFPIGIFYLWRFGALRDWRASLIASGAAIGMFALLLAIYLLTTHSLSLWTFTAGNSQFNDVVHEVPILRPFSRSVQAANLMIRTKFFLTEAPIYLAIIPILIGWIGYSLYKKDSKALHATLAIPVLLVLLSWLFLNGAQITYLTHLLPVLAFATMVIVNRWTRHLSSALMLGLALAVAMPLAITATRDARAAEEEANKISNANHVAVARIMAAIRHQGSLRERPRILTEPYSLDALTCYDSIDVATDHFISFPEKRETTSEFLHHNNIRYVVLFNSPAYPKDRPEDDPFYRDVNHACTKVLRVTGTLGDMGRTYFEPSASLIDTLTLLRVND